MLVDRLFCFRCASTILRRVPFSSLFVYPEKISSLDLLIRSLREDCLQLNGNDRLALIRNFKLCDKFSLIGDQRFYTVRLIRCIKCLRAAIWFAGF